MAAEVANSISPASSFLPLDGRVAIITRGSRGIGRAISVHLHSLGARVVINYSSNSTEANKLVSDLNAAPRLPRAVTVQADVSDPLQVKLIFDKAEQEFDFPVHILVNSAGAIDSKYPPLANTTVEDWDKTFSVNSREGANKVKRDGSGRIIMISTSIVGSFPPGYGAYGASKITANCVVPGPIATDFFFQGKAEEMVQRFVYGWPMERLGEPPDVAAVVGFLSGDGGEWVNGQVIRVNGGITV